MSSRAFYLESGSAPVFALYDEPHARSEQERASVLLLPLFGNDEICSYRARRAWALSLASGGHAVLRVDLPGTGDSPGGPNDPALLDAWLESVASAAAWLKRERAARVVAVGIDLGGMLAYRATADGAAIDDLVLWSVPSRGRALVRHKRALAQMEAAAEQSGDGSEAAVAQDGSLASAGFLLSSETVASLEALDLAALELPGAAERRILLLQRDGLDVDARLRAAVESAGAQSEVLPGPGYGEMVAPPQESYPPLAVFETVAHWLAQAPPGDPALEAEAAPRAAHGESATRLELAVGATRVHERPVVIPFGEERLFGVLAEPAEPSRRAEICAILLNAGAIRHVGPGRMWVELARRWASQGVSTLRIDYAGIGDAEGGPEFLRDNADFYVARTMQESRTVLGALAGLGLPDRFLICGLCSGAYWSLYAAAEDERVAGAYLVNPRVLVWNPHLKVIRDGRNVRKAIKPDSWRKLITGQITNERIRNVATGAAVSLRGLPARHRRLARENEVLDEVLSSVQAAGSEVLMLFCDGEPLLEELERDRTIERITRRENVRLGRIPGPPSHTLEPLSAQRAVHAALDQALARQIAALRAPSATAEDPAQAAAASGQHAS